eukprot:966440-Rhodomonas_salina.1
MRCPVPTWRPSVPASETQTQNPSMFGYVATRWTVARGFSIVKSVPRRTPPIVLGACYAMSGADI